MSSFFSTASTDNQLQISPQFWIFWSFSIPLTVVVLVVYILWVQRAEVRDWYAEMRKRHSRLQKMLRSGRQRGGDVEKGQEGRKQV
jgi:hypothetical protein